MTRIEDTRGQAQFLLESRARRRWAVGNRYTLNFNAPQQWRD
jgi:hypothetical protein